MYTKEGLNNNSGIWAILHHCFVYRQIKVKVAVTNYLQALNFFSCISTIAREYDYEALWMTWNRNVHSINGFHSFTRMCVSPNIYVRISDWYFCLPDPIKKKIRHLNVRIRYSIDLQLHFYNYEAWMDSGKFKYKKKYVPPRNTNHLVRNYDRQILPAKLKVISW